MNCLAEFFIWTNRSMASYDTIEISIYLICLTVFAATFLVESIEINETNVIFCSEDEKISKMLLCQVFVRGQFEYVRAVNTCSWNVLNMNYRFVDFVLLKRKELFYFSDCSHILFDRKLRNLYAVFECVSIS